MFISFIIITYNRPKLLKRAIDSIMMSGIDDYEIIIVDDGSITQSLCDSMINIPNIKYIKLKENTSNESLCRNKALEYAQGKYIRYCDDDDYLEPYSLFNEVSILKEKDLENIDIIFYQRFLYKHDTSPYDLLTKINVFHGISNFFIKREFKIKNKIVFDEYKAKSMSEDLVYFVNIMINNPKYFIYEESNYFGTVTNWYDVRKYHTNSRFSNEDIIEGIKRNILDIYFDQINKCEKREYDIIMSAIRRRMPINNKNTNEIYRNINLSIEE